MKPSTRSHNSYSLVTVIEDLKRPKNNTMKMKEKMSISPPRKKNQ